MNTPSDSSDSDISPERPPPMGKGKSKGALRFPVGTDVVCNTEDGWELGTIVGHWFRSPEFPPGYAAPYQVRLRSGDFIYVPEDAEDLCCKWAVTWWEKAFMSKEYPVAQKLRNAAGEQGVDLDERNFEGVTAIAACARIGQHECVKVLSELGASANVTDKKGRSPLHLVVERWRQASLEQLAVNIQLLLDARANPNAQDKDPEKDPEFKSTSFQEREAHRTALHYCAAVDCIPAAKALLKATADANIIDGQYKTPLHLAIDEESSREMIHFLLASKSDPNKGNIEIGMDSSYLFVAARTGNVQLAADLIDARADVNLAGKRGMTPLHMAARSRKQDVVKMLIEAKCDTDIKMMGKTAAELALTNGDSAIAQMLGADANTCRQSDKKRKLELYLD